MQIRNFLYNTYNKIISSYLSIIKNNKSIKSYLLELIVVGKFANKFLKFANPKNIKSFIKKLFNHRKIFPQQYFNACLFACHLNQINNSLAEYDNKISFINNLIDNINKKIEFLNKEVDKHNLKLESYNYYISKLFDEFKSLRILQEKSISAIGARWGMKTEKSFRNALRSILEEEYGIKVEYYVKFDDEGIVFDQPDQVELDVIIKSGKIIVLEIKSSVSKGDIVTFSRKIKFFEKHEQKKVYRKMIVSPMIDSKNLEFAKRLGIEVYSYPDEVELDNE